MSAISPHFMCLSMLLNNRHIDPERPIQTWMDTLAMAIACDDGDEPMPPLVARTAEEARRWAREGSGATA